MVVNLAARRYLADLVSAARDVLGDDLVGAYAAGSLALDAYEPGRSDIDVALVTEDRFPDEHKHPSRSRPVRPPDPGFELEPNTGAAMGFRATYHWQDRLESDGGSGTASTAASCTRAACSSTGRPPRRCSPTSHSPTCGTCLSTP